MTGHGPNPDSPSPLPRGAADGPAPIAAGRARRRLGLKARFAAIFAGVLLVVNLVVLATQRAPIVAAFERDFRLRGADLARQTAARAKDRMDASRPDALRDLVEALHEFEDVREASIVARNGAVLAAAPAAAAPGAPSRWPRGREVVEEDGETDGEDETRFLAAVPGSDVVVRLRLSRASLSRTISRIGWTIVGIAAVTVGAGFLLVFLAAGAFTRPIRSLADLAGRIRRGELGAQAAFARSDEIGELAAAMDGMAPPRPATPAGRRRATAGGAGHTAGRRRLGGHREAQTRNLETLVASIAEGVLFVGTDGRVAVANGAAERILGVPQARLRGRLLQEISLPETDARLPALLADACDRGARGERHHAQVLCADHLHTVTTVRDPGGAALGVLLVVQDLSHIHALEAEQKDLLGRLHEQEKMAIVGLLGASLAHELNTPLGTILLHTQRVAQDLDGNPHAKALGAVVGEVLRCREIVRRLLDFSRQSESRPAPLDLSEPVERCISLAEAGLRQRGISISKSVEADVPVVLADESRIEEVLMNLVSNASDAMPSGGRIEIALGADGAGGAEIRVRDEGRGVPPEIRDRVFEPFFTTKPRGKGTGLGLAICRRIMDEHRGSIDLAPREGGGTEVRLRLPPAEGDRA